jgi:CelD/BcsL family acetyltransferase involved in cellulose biosynthesis
MVSADIPPALQRPSILRPVRFDDIPRAAWARLHALTPAATPFSSWTFQRAWWDAYGASAREHHLVLTESVADAPSPVGAPTRGLGPEERITAIVPLMLRPTDPGSGPDAASEPQRTLYFGASYHADYATVLADPGDLPRVADLLAEHLVDLLLAGEVDRVDLRRLAESDRLLDVLPPALGRAAQGSSLGLRLVQEDVCPVIDLEEDWPAQLARLDKKSRHEVRRKVRRAERTGPIELRYLPLDEAAAERFIRFHQARWGAAGLFAEGVDGDRGRVFIRRLTELEGAAESAATESAAAEGAAGLHIGEVSVAGEPLYLLAGFVSRDTCYFYNAGLDPTYLDLSPGIVGTAAYLRDRIERGDARFDFLRGDEPYKYAWAARDTRLMRLVLEAGRLDPAEGVAEPVGQPRTTAQ